MNKSDNINELADSLSKFQAEVKDAPRLSKSYNGKYAKLEDIFSIVRPLLSKHGLSFMQPSHSTTGKEVTVETIIMHKSGQYISAGMTIEIPPKSGNTNSLQQIGVALSYAKRYSIMSMLGCCQKDEDDDADSFTEEKPKFDNAKQPPRPEPKKEITKWELNEILLSELKTKITKANYTEERVCSRFNLKSIDQLNQEQYEKTIRVCDKAIAELKGAK